MKKCFIIISLAVCCFGCGNNTESTSDAKKDTAKSTTSVMDNPDYEKGLNLVAKSDCFTCHKLRDQSTGPAYGAVAAKYENTEANINMLADKVIKGGSGVWGQVPMVQHPQISKEDAVAMVKYILLLKEEKK
jgi:cytochrome c